MKDVCNGIVLTNEKDMIKWTLEKWCILIKSYYRKLIENCINFPHKFMWKTKIPQIVKIFTQLVLRNSIMIKDNLIRRGWTSSRACPFCGLDESIDHLFMKCSLARMLWNIIKCTFNLFVIPDNADALLNTWLKSFHPDEKHLVFTGVSMVFWTIWKIRNSTIFDNAKVSDPCVPINMITRWLNDWIILQKK